MTKIDKIQYSQTEVVFVMEYYDMPLKGTCIYKNSLCYFETEMGGWDHKTEEFEISYTNIFKLNFFERIKYRINQFTFEVCVGYNYSYKAKEIPFIKKRKPKVLFDLLFKMYYL
jgi:hypothetical protein